MSKSAGAAAPKLVDNSRERKRRRRKKKATRVTALLLAVTGLVLLIFRDDIDYYSIKLRMQAIMSAGSGADRAVESTMSYDSASAAAFGSYKESLVILTQTGLSVYRSDGTLSLDQPLSIGSPALACSGGRFLAFDRGGRALYVCSGSSIIEKRETTGSIIDADLSDGGWYAVAEQDSQLRAVVTLYSSYGKPAYVWNSASSYVGLVAVGDGGKMAVAGVEVENGALISTIVLLDKSSEQPVARYRLEGELIVQLEYSGDVVTAVTDLGVLRFDGRGDQPSRYDLQNASLLGCSIDSGGNVALMLGRFSAGQGGSLTLVSSGLAETGAADITRDIRYMASRSGRTAVIYDGGGAVYDSEARLITEVVLSGPKAVVVTRSGRVIFVQADKMTSFG